MNAGKRLRRIHRYRTIAAALVRNGFGQVLQQMKLFEWLPFSLKEERSDMRNQSIGARIRTILEELGPTFIKLGQIASTRSDLIPRPILQELSKLQDDVPPFSYEEAKAILEHELGAPVDQLFRDLQKEPLAAASIGQVYQATLQDGTKVAVKVQRPKIAQLIDTDLEILTDLARLAEQTIDWARKYRLCDIVDELGRALRMELDYMAEARNAERFAEHSKSWPHVHIPEIYWEYCTSRVLTMAYKEGIRLSDAERLDQAGIDKRQTAITVANCILHQILLDGFFHGDPHPGNIFVQQNGELVLLDFGMVGRLTPAMKKHFASFVIALRNQSTKGVIRAISNMGFVPNDVHHEQLFADVEKLREKYYKVPLKKVSLAEAVQDLFHVALLHRIHIPAELTLLGKSLLTMEGVVSALDPTLSVIDIAEPFGKKLFIEQFSPKKLLQEWTEELPEWLDLLRELPSSLKHLIAHLQKDSLQLDVKVPQLEQMMRKLDRIGNRLSFSVVLLSLSIVMVGMVVGSSLRDSDLFLWRLPVIEIGFLIVLFLFLWLILSIFRSGRF